MFSQLIFEIQLVFHDLLKFGIFFFTICHTQCEGETDPVKLQMTANAIALMARSLSFDSEFMSPFSVNARRNNINATGKFTFSIVFFCC